MRKEDRVVLNMTFQILLSAEDHSTAAMARAVEGFSRSGTVKPKQPRAWIVGVFVPWRNGLVCGSVVSFTGNIPGKG